MSTLETLETEVKNKNDVAVVGISCRFPGAGNPSEFWELLRNEQDALGPVPVSRREAFRAQGISTGGFLKNVESADGDFFGLSQGELEAMDPQQVLALELLWELLEDAGLPAGQMEKKSVGVFLGVATVDHAHLSLSEPGNIGPFSNTGAAASIIANRLSYFFNLRGPSMIVDTACSSSLTAVHLACRALENNECETAVAGGVNLMLHQAIPIGYKRAGLLSGDGRCRPFDERADGIVRGEGGGMVLLKSLKRAQRDGDQIYGVIRGSGVNQDGRSAGLPAPNRPAQARLLRETYARAGVSPHSVDFVETHGTGTPLGDPIEAGALGEVLGKAKGRIRPLLLGGVKSNIGHLEAAAGVAGLIKTLLMISHKHLLANADFQNPNPLIKFKENGMWISDLDRPWNPQGAESPLRAGVSSFGFGGSNAHVILEEAPGMTPHEKPETNEAAETIETSRLLLLSAANESALGVNARQYLDFVRKNEGVNTADLVHSAALHREHLSSRAALMFRNREELLTGLESMEKGESFPGLSNGIANPGRGPKPVFVYSGQGPIIYSFLESLPWDETVFNDSVRQLDNLVRTIAGWSLLDTLMLGTGEANRPNFAQPILFCLQMALTDLWISFGVSPRAVVGHSLGEIAAASAAGIISREEGLNLALQRGALLEETGGRGAMAVLGLNVEGTEQFLSRHGGGAVVAALNDETSTVISGEKEAVGALVEAAENSKVYVRLLRGVDFASHSPLMEGVARDLSKSFSQLRPQDSRIAFYSTVTGTHLAGQNLGGEYWGRNLREPVLFSRAIRELEADGYSTFLEVSPVSLLTHSLTLNTSLEAHVVRGLRSDRPGRNALLDSLGSLYTAGVPLNWERVFQDGTRIQLPTYPFQRKEYYVFQNKAGSHTRVVNSDVLIEEIQADAAEESRKLPVDLNLDNYLKLNEYMDQQTEVYILNCLKELGLFLKPGTIHTLEDMSATSGIRDEFLPLLERWLNRLVERDLLSRSGEAYVCPGQIKTENIRGAGPPERIKMGAGESAILNYFMDSGESLSGILRGESSSLETLFPGGDFSRANDLYRHNPVARYSNDILARALQSAAARIPAGKTLRVLEIGAGTGGTTARVLPLLAPFSVDYCFTDLSDFFFRRAREDFKAYEFLNYKTLNIELSPEEQGFASGSYDVVLATNSLHAARDLKQALSFASVLLSPGGFLLLNEVTEYRPWFDVTTALIEGWQRFEDGVRQDVPLVSVETWENLLSEKFSNVTALPESGSPVRSLGQSVFMAFKAGEGSVNRSAGVAESDKTLPREAFSDLRKGIMESSPAKRRELLGHYLSSRVKRLLPGERPLDESLPLAAQGFDSLSALELLNQIRQELGVELSVKGLRNNPTLQDLVGLCSGESEKVSPSLESLEKVSPVTTLLEGGELSPLILIHPGGLDLGCYENFSRLLAGKRALYVLSPPELNYYGDSAGKKTTSIQEGAALCAQILKESALIGPGSSFRLGGWSFGGVLAWETARILDGEGFAPEGLELFDSFQAPQDHEEEIKCWFISCLRTRFGLVESGEDTNTEGLLARLQKDGLLPVSTSPALMDEFYESYRQGVQSCLEQVQDYLPEKLDMPVTLFEARDQVQKNLSGMSFWEQVHGNPERAPAGFTIHLVPGDHYSIWNEEGAALMAKALGDALSYSETR